MDEFEWKTLPEESNEALAWFAGHDGSAESMPDGSMRKMFTRKARAKWDGCVDYWAYHNGCEHDHACTGDKCECASDYLHICDIDAFIEELQVLKRAAVAYFREHQDGYGYEYYWKYGEEEDTCTQQP